jgi:Ca2+:H+ antiporter
MNLGLRPAEIVLLALTLIVTILTIVPGRATIINAMVHLSIFGSFIALVFLP